MRSQHAWAAYLKCRYEPSANNDERALLICVAAVGRLRRGSCMCEWQIILDGSGRAFAIRSLLVRPLFLLPREPTQ